MVESEAILECLAVVSIQVDSVRIERLTRSNSVPYLREQILIYISIYPTSRAFSTPLERELLVATTGGELSVNGQ